MEVPLLSDECGGHAYVKGDVNRQMTKSFFICIWCVELEWRFLCHPCTLYKIAKDIPLILFSRFNVLVICHYGQLDRHLRPHSHLYHES